MSNYEVGYGKPPRSGQIRKGEIRNPHGRKGKKKSQAAASGAELLEQIDAEPVLVNGRWMTRREAHIRAQYMSACKGKSRAIKFIDTLSRRVDSESQGGGVLVLPYFSEDGSWDPKDALAQHNIQRKLDQRNALRRARRAEAKADGNQVLQLKADWEILSDLENEGIVFDGREMSMHEFRLRAWKAFAVRGNGAAQTAISRIQNTARTAAKATPGVLVVPGMLPMEQWTELAGRQQAPFREQPLSDEFDDL